jgi:DNA repair protein RadA/Sms
MAKSKSVFVCQQCGAQRPRWEGRCSDCGAWNSFVEERAIAPMKGKRASWTTGDGGAGPGLVGLDQETTGPAPARITTGIGELNRVLGGGLVPGSFVLVGGDPGIGKSTLLLQMSAGLAAGGAGVLYVSAEESVQQIALRARRLGVRTGDVKVTAESSVERIVQTALEVRPPVLIVDSIQTVFLEEISSAPGSVGQVRESAARLMGLAKGQGITVFIIGHVTKEGTLAGPRVLEHMVDTVLSFEGDGHHHYRLLRAIKNRFGATNELGVFEMAEVGLREVDNPSAIFLEEHGDNRIGAAIFPALEGSRPVLCEVQALTSYSVMANPRRTSVGVDLNRVHMLCAVLDKFVHMEVGREDVFINVVGGLRLSEPAADLAVAAALWSSKSFRELPKAAVFFGELGLTGEVRSTVFAEDRMKEAAKLGFKVAYLPKVNQRLLKDSPMCKQMDCRWVADLQDLARQLGKDSLPGAPQTKRRKSSDEDRRREMDV